MVEEIRAKDVCGYITIVHGFYDAVKAVKKWPSPMGQLGLGSLISDSKRTGPIWLGMMDQMEQARLLKCSSKSYRAYLAQCIFFLIKYI